MAFPFVSKARKGTLQTKITDEQMNRYIKECWQMKVLESIVVAFSMYSKIPMPHIEWNKENMKKCALLFSMGRSSSRSSGLVVVLGQ